ncbi:putative membrane protein [Helicobacter pylori Hp H-45]|uniref:Putative membrane protein n=1 Tax=Helicobacter pylori Hp H-45 TaxID=992050 RepID=I9TKY1_HELPX|nr:putative membrane protein [Helicobacter pylori Hp H-45]
MFNIVSVFVLVGFLNLIFSFLCLSFYFLFFVFCFKFCFLEF